VRRLRVTEARTILFSALPEVYYYEYSKALFNSTFRKYFSSVVASGCECSRPSLEKALYDTRSNVFLDVEGSVNHVSMVKNTFGMYGLFTCFSGCGFLTVFRQGVGAYFSGYGDGVDCLE